MEIKVKRLTSTAKLPTKAHSSDCGLDVYADGDYIIRPGETVKVKTGIAIEMSECCNAASWTTGALIWDRSGLGSKGIHRLAGVVDHAYRGEILVCLTNLNTTQLFNCILNHYDSDRFLEYFSEDMKNNSFCIKQGDKIAQILIQQVLKVDVIEVSELNDTDRGEKGFGSSGK